MDQLPVIDIKGLQITFKSLHDEATAVAGIDLQIKRGELLAIVGESGSGKTVTALSLLRLLPPAKIILNGHIKFSSDGTTAIELHDQSEKQMQKIRGHNIGMIFQEPMTSLNPLMNCGTQVIETIRAHTHLSIIEAKQKTIELFKTVGLPDPENLLKKFPHELSGGQKQRVMIAIAICCNPALLIADEPTTALDATVQKKVLTLIRELQIARNMAVLFITHDLNLVANIADNIVVMLNGKIIEHGTVEKIFKNPSHPYTKALLACRPDEQSKGRKLLQTSDYLNPAAQPQKIKEQVGNSTTAIREKVIVEVKDLVINFTPRKNIFSKPVHTANAIDNISFSILEGEVLGIVGESGSGKTTLGRALVRLLKPTSGKILFKGEDIAVKNEAEIKKMRHEMQIIFQDPFGSLNPRMTIGAAIEEPIKVQGLFRNADQRRQKVFDLLKRVGLNPSFFNRYPHEFSGGQRQRICIARAIAVNPSFIICDESVSALDVSVQAQILNLIMELKQEIGFTCVFISHDLSVVRYISDRILVMKSGRIVEIGDADRVYFKPEKDYTKVLLESVPRSPFIIN